MKKIKISVIIPVYNTERYLNKCLDSVINQTLEDIEIICINDGSTDKSLEILQQYAQKDERIIIINQTNQKQGAARNRGLEIARGEFITFVDSDDWIDLDYAEKLYNSAIQNNVNMSVATMTRDKKNKIKNHLKLKYKEVFHGATEIIKAINNHLETASKLYRRELIKDLRFAENVYYEDSGYTIRAINQCISCVTVPDTIYHYVSNPHSTIKSRKNAKKKRRDRISASLDVINYAKENNIKIPEKLIIKDDYFLFSIKHYTHYSNYYFCGIKFFKIKRNNIQRYRREYKLYYFGGKKNKNAGDVFNVDLMEYFGIPYKRSRKIEKANLICIGSNIDKLAIPSSTKILIVGAGFIFPPKDNDSLKREIEVLAIRGNLSKQRLEKLLQKFLDTCPLGDPGLLISKMYPISLSKKYKVGIIPHYYDKVALNKNAINLEKGNYKIIDIQQDAKVVASEICECECILSSSLHGLIFADSYNIPNRQIILSDKLAGGNYKFKDYYSAFGLEFPEPIDLRLTAIDNDLIDTTMASYQIKDILKKQEEIELVFEKLLKNFQ